MAHSQVTLTKEKVREFDFLDFGSSNGSSMSWASSRFGGIGLGIDRDPKKIEQLLSKGLNGIIADATKIKISSNSVRYTVISEFLEHLPNIDVVEKVIKEAYRVAQDFIIIRGPNFEHVSALKKLGFKPFYADWSGHTCHHKIPELARIVKNLGSSKFLIRETLPIVDSYSSAVIPINAPKNQHQYDPKKHSSKKFVVFPKNLFFEKLVIVIAKSAEVSLGEISNLCSYDRLRYIDGEAGGDTSLLVSIETVI